MDKTYCERDEHGREVGVLVHNGHEFRALGASVQGEYVCGYLGKNDELKTWCGRIMLDCRAERHGDYWNEQHGDAFGIIFRLTHGRAIVGYCLGVGMLFRGELVKEFGSERELSRECDRVCDHWLQIDAEDFERDQAEQREEQEFEEEEEREREAESMARELDA